MLLLVTLQYCVCHRSASTTVLTEVSGVASGLNRKNLVDKILRSASDNCLASTKTCTTNKPPKPSHANKLCTNRAKNKKLARKNVAMIDACTKLPVHKSSSEGLLGQHQGTTAFKADPGKHRSRKRVPNQTMSAPTSPGKCYIWIPPPRARTLSHQPL